MSARDFPGATSSSKTSILPLPSNTNERKEEISKRTCGAKPELEKGPPSSSTNECFEGSSGPESGSVCPRSELDDMV